MEGLPVSYSLNSGDNGNNWWGDFIGAAIGGAAGAAWGRGNNNGCCGNGGGGCCNNNDQFIMDTLTTMRTDVNGIGRDQLIQTQQIGQGICQGFSVNLRPRMPRLLSSKPSSSIPLLPQAMRSRPAMKCRARPRSFSQRFVTARRPPLAVHPPKSSL